MMTRRDDLAAHVDDEETSAGSGGCDGCRGGDGANCRRVRENLALMDVAGPVPPSRAASADKPG